MKLTKFAHWRVEYERRRVLSDVRGSGHVMALRTIALGLVLAALLRNASAEFSCPKLCVCVADSAADCSGRGMVVVPSEGFDLDTHRIVLSDNNISELEDSVLFNTGVRGLQELVLSGNRVSRVANDAFFGQRRLQLVDLSHNALRNLSLSPFRRTPRLHTLLLAHNPLLTLDGSGAPPSLTTLNLSSCRLLYVLEGDPIGTGVAYLPGTLLESLRNLQLDGNPLICDCRQMPTYRRLELLGLARDTRCGNSQNNFWQSALELIDCTPCPRGCTCKNPKVANCSGVGLEDVPQRGLSNSLTTFVLSNNNITRINKGTFEPVNVTAVEVLLLDHNAIWLLDEDSFNGMPQLRRLDLSHNALVGLPVGMLEAAGLSSLEELVLAHNYVSHVAAAAFYPLRRLRRLDLSHNQLLALPFSVLAGASNLIEFSVAGNRLRNLSWLDAGTDFKSLDPRATLRQLNVADNLVEIVTVTEVAPLEGLRVFILEGNPLSCNASLAAAFHVLESRGLARDSRCHNPLELRGRYWQVLDMSAPPVAALSAGQSLLRFVKGSNTNCSSQEQVLQTYPLAEAIGVTAAVAFTIWLITVILFVFFWKRNLRSRFKKPPDTETPELLNRGFAGACS